MKATRVSHQAVTPPDTVVLEMSLAEAGMLAFLANRDHIIPDALKKATYNDDVVRQVCAWQHDVQTVLWSVVNAPSL